MAEIDDLLTSLKAEYVTLVDNKRARLKIGCFDCDCDDEIDAIDNRIQYIEFNNKDFSPSGSNSMLTQLPNTLMGSLVITISDFELNGYTYLNPGLAGNTTYQVFLNTIANRYLEFELDGFIRLPQGGFIIDPLKLELQSGQRLIIII